MLALADDAALARLVIAATRIPSRLHNLAHYAALLSIRASRR
jgi:hypothetical protein